MYVVFLSKIQSVTKENFLQILGQMSSFSNCYNYVFSLTGVQVQQRRVGKITVKACCPRLNVLVAIMNGTQEVNHCHKKSLQLLPC